MWLIKGLLLIYSYEQCDGWILRFQKQMRPKGSTYLWNKIIYNASGA